MNRIIAVGLLCGGLPFVPGCSRSGQQAEYGRSDVAGWTDWDEMAEARAERAAEREQQRSAPATESVTLRMINVQLEQSLAQLCGIALPSAFFEFDSSELRERAPEMLDRLAECLKSDELVDRRIVLVGFADRRGPDEYNRELAASRAQSVAGYLAARGIDPRRIEIVSRGEEIASGRAEDSVFDRRVDIGLLHE